MKISRILIFMMCGVLLLAGCHSSRHSGIPTDANKSLEPVETLWTDLEVPLNISLNSPTRANVAARVKMVRGQMIDVSLRIIGFEVGRLYVTEDSVFGMIKPSKVYMAESLKDVAGQFPVTVSDIQDMLIGTKTTQPAGSKLSVSYDDFIDMDQAGRVASIVNMNAMLGKTLIDGSLSWKWASSKWNEGVSVKWQLPSGYRRITPRELLSNLAL